MISYHLFPRYLYCIPNYSRTQFWQSAGQSNSAPFFLMILHTKYISTYILCTYYVQSRSAHWAEANKKVPKTPTDFKIIFIQQSFKSSLVPKKYTNLSFEVNKNIKCASKKRKKIVGHFSVKQPKVNCRQQCNINWTNAFCC